VDVVISRAYKFMHEHTHT